MSGTITSNIKGIGQVIDTEADAIELAKDVMAKAEEYKKKEEYFHTSPLTITETALDAFKEQFLKMGGTTREGWYPKPLAKTNPVFNGCKTKLIFFIDCFASYEHDYKGKPSMLINNASRCIKYGADWYKPYNSYKCNGERFELCPVCPSPVIRDYRSKISELKITKPNYVGTMTPRKLKAWVDYFTEIECLCEQKKQEIDHKTQDFKNRLKKIAPDMADHPYGRIEKNGIAYSWNLDDSGNPNDGVSICASVYFNGCTSMEVFEMLSDNKFKPKKLK